jgi:monoamine oxidase
MSRSLYSQLHRRFGQPESLTSRRNFLKATAAAGTALLLSGCKPLVDQKIDLAMAKRRVIVVGGGFAGLACAHELRAADYDVIVLEARNRVGGRVLSFTDFVPGKSVEGGGELIGNNHPVWLAYARRFNLQMLNLAGDDSLNQPLVLNGQKLSDADAKTLYAEMTVALNRMNDDARPIDAEQPWLSNNAAALDARTVADWLQSIDASPRCKAAVAAQLEGNNAVPLERQSYLGNLAQIKGGGVERYWTDTETLICKGGNQQLATMLARDIGMNRIYLTTGVKSIELTDNGVAITTADGVRMEGDDVVLAVPPTIWPKMDFSPALPDGLNPQMGTAVKYLADVRSRFWAEHHQSPNAQTDGAISMTWEATQNQPGSPQACLTAFSGGPAAETCRAIPPDQRDASYAAALEQIYPGFKEAFEQSRFMDWPSDPNTRGGYSFPAPGQLTTVGPLLRAGIHDRLHFAGEHTCYKFVGYMEGALDSGARIAKHLVTRDHAAALAQLQKQ